MGRVHVHVMSARAWKRSWSGAGAGPKPRGKRDRTEDDWRASLHTLGATLKARPAVRRWGGVRMGRQGGLCYESSP